MAEYLYLHIPFCVRKCVYCDFLSLPYDKALASAYATALCRELEMKKHMAGALKTVFIGGGTPTTLPEASLEQIFSCIREHYTLRPDAEISIEANPGTVTREKAAILVAQGVNRISLGVQSFNDNELNTLGRVHSAEEAISSAGTFLSSGLENLSLDLMYGIPGQTMETWKGSLSAAVGLAPKHISAYELTPEKGTPLKESLDSGNLSLPDEESVLAMSSLAIDALGTSGFQHYEISNYALPGYQCVHNMNYWNRGEYLAAGAGAHSFLHGYRSTNTGSVPEYISVLGNDVIPEVDSAHLSGEEAQREFIMLGLRKIGGVHLKEASDLKLDIATAARALIESGFLEITGNFLRLTRKGLPIANAVIVRLLQDLEL
ncbi:MAG: radical SAM family heme chaperone HemW [Nitrospirae bacterium]|nr:radical SAM family heme chaperone HemW [Nitrospirota bacterium]